jgi:hypothetical protein
MGFEPTISAFERAKTVDVLDRAATVNGGLITCSRRNHLLIILTDAKDGFVAPQSRETVPWDSELRTTMLARINNNLPG